VPGGGLAEDRTPWRPSRANFSVPVQALAPIYRALFKEAMDQAGLLAPIDPRVWHITWNVHRQAPPNGHPSFQDRAPEVCTVAIANRRIVALQARTVPCTSRTPGRSRPRTPHLDVMALLRRFLQHVLPDGCMKVRHCGFRHASCALPPDTLRLMILQAHPIDCRPTQSVPPAPLAALCPTCGAQMHVVMRLWTSNRALGDTGCACECGHDELSAAPFVKTLAPVCPQHGIRQLGAADDRIKTTHRDSKMFPISLDDTPMAVPPPGLKLTPHILP
jgi:hypothetical protein